MCGSILGNSASLRYGLFPFKHVGSPNWLITLLPCSMLEQIQCFLQSAANLPRSGMLTLSSHSCQCCLWCWELATLLGSLSAKAKYICVWIYVLFSFSTNSPSLSVWWLPNLHISQPQILKGSLWFGSVKWVPFRRKVKETVGCDGCTNLKARYKIK